MGWLWGSESSENEAVRNLDPSLRKFLEDEKPAERPPQPPAPEPQAHIDLLRPLKARSPQATSDEAHLVPKESLYQDGRYAHLWKNYRPLSEIEAAGKTDQDRMTDLVESISERKFQLKEAATENCALENLAIQDCFKSFNVWSKLSLCRKENRAFDRCFDMQVKFLKALGYMGQVGNTEQMEKVQMHADGLFRQMIEQEKTRKEAEEKGLPVPKFQPIMSKENISRAMGTNGIAMREQDVWSKVKPEKRPQFEKRLKGLDAEERELEMRIIENELQMELDRRQGVSDVFREEQEARMQRKREGRATITDKAKGWWGWGEDEKR